MLLLRNHCFSHYYYYYYYYYYVKFCQKNTKFYIVVKIIISWFQTFSLFWMLYTFFWVIPRRLNFIFRRFGTHCLFNLHRQVGVKCDCIWEMLECLYRKRVGSYKYCSISHMQPFFIPTCLWRWNSVPKRRHIKFRCRGITKKRACEVINVNLVVYLKERGHLIEPNEHERIILERIFKEVDVRECSEGLWVRGDREGGWEGERREREREEERGVREREGWRESGNLSWRKINYLLPSTKWLWYLG